MVSHPMDRKSNATFGSILDSGGLSQSPISHQEVLGAARKLPQRTQSCLEPGSGIWYPKNGRHEVWYFDLVEVGREESESELPAGFSEGCGATGRRWRAQRSGGGAVVGDIGEDLGELGRAGASRRGTDAKVGERAGERTASGADAIAARGCEAADGEGEPRKSGGVLRQGVDVKYAWIEAHIGSYPVRPMCELLGVSASGFYAERSRAPAARAAEQVQIVGEIRRAQTRHRGRYGRRRMTAEVGAVLGRPVNEKRIGRLMRIHDPASRKRRRFHVVTTDSKHLHPVALNVLRRDFEATAPNQKWLADLTYIPTDEGWLYLARVLDLLSRKLAGR